eukprot:SAG31_NODE_917_length_11033_cov_3.285897_6_plen_201_part_00
MAGPDQHMLATSEALVCGCAHLRGPVRSNLTICAVARDSRHDFVAVGVVVERDHPAATSPVGPECDHLFCEPGGLGCREGAAVAPLKAIACVGRNCTAHRLTPTAKWIPVNAGQLDVEKTACGGVRGARLDAAAALPHRRDHIVFLCPALDAGKQYNRRGSRANAEHRMTHESRARLALRRSPVQPSHLHRRGQHCARGE